MRIKLPLFIFTITNLFLFTSCTDFLNKKLGFEENRTKIYQRVDGSTTFSITTNANVNDFINFVKSDIQNEKKIQTINLKVISCQNLNDILDKFSEFTSLKIILSFSDLQDNTVLSENAAISLLNVDELILPYDSSYAEVSYNTFYIDTNNVRLQKVIFPAQIIFISKKFITTSEDMVFGFEVIFDNNTGWYLETETETKPIEPDNLSSTFLQNINSYNFKK